MSGKGKPKEDGKEKDLAHLNVPPGGVASFYDTLAPVYAEIFRDFEETVRWQAKAIHGLMVSGNVLNRILVDDDNAEKNGDAEKKTPHNDIRVLDCACGIGTQVLALLTANQEQTRASYVVHGADLSQGAIAEAARRVSASAKSESSEKMFDVCAFKDLGTLFAGKEGKKVCFDVVIAFDNALPHLLSNKDMRDSLLGMISVLRRDGRGHVMFSMRDYDAILDTREREQSKQPITFEGPRRMGTEEGKDARIVFQQWSWFQLDPNSGEALGAHPKTTAAQADDVSTARHWAYCLDMFVLRKEHRGGTPGSSQANDVSPARVPSKTSSQSQRWSTTHQRTMYRAWRRADLTALLKEVGLVDICWYVDGEFYQPVVIARLPSTHHA